MSARPTIFVSIAAYRDREALPTIKDIFDKAAHPENIHVSICWQYNSLRDEPFTISDRKSQVSVINVDYKKARGLGWARHLTQKLYGGETYYLQIDSHSRFIANWDSEMIDQLNRCPSEKAILTTYPNHYELPNKLIDYGPYKLIYDNFFQKVPLFHSRFCTEEEKVAPSVSLMVSGGFVFTKGQAVLDVPYDPYGFYVGDEISMAVRYWTYGYDFFTPTRTLMFHLYAVHDEDKNHHIRDHPSWYDEYRRTSLARIHHLLGIEKTTDPMALREIQRYGLAPYGQGNHRSLAQYEAFAGIDFKTQTLTENAKLGIPSNL